jgi:hypothetical protein
MPKSQIHVVSSNINMNIHPTYILQSLPFSISFPYGSLDAYYSEISQTIEDSIFVATEKLKELGVDNFYIESTNEEVGMDIHDMYNSALAQKDIDTDLTIGEYCENNDIGAKFHKITFKPYYYGVPLLEANQVFYDGEMYHSPMEYEVISMRVSQDGIAEFKWTNPTDISNVINDNVKIITLENAIENAKQFMMLKYNLPTMITLDSDRPDYSSINANINIDTIKLGLAGVPAADSTDEYLLIPVWNFYGSYSVESDDEGVICAFDLTRIPFISINAIDGSIIHQTSYVIDDLT